MTPLLFCMTQLPPYLTDQDIDAVIARALEEDLGAGDVTTQATVDPATRATGHFLAKADGVVAGLYVAERVFQAVDTDVRVTWHADDGGAVTQGMRIGTVEGPAHGLLSAERLALNLMQRMSGIATATRRMVTAASPHGAQILDTRKTAPGLRLLDKWAVKLGGGANHRIGLYDMILVKDNHIAAAGGVAEAVRAAQRWRDEHHPGLQIEVETRTLDEVRTVLEIGDVNFILLDNMVDRQDDGTVDTSRLAEAVALIDGRIATEASGNVTLETVSAIAATGVDYISSGALTHSVRALDVSLTIDLD